MKRPVLIALIGYIIGIIWELYLGISIAPVLIAILVFYCCSILINGQAMPNSTVNYALFVEYIKRIVYSILFKKDNKIVFIILTSMLISNSITTHLNNRYENLFKGIERNSNIVATVISDEKQKEYTTSYTIKVNKINGDSKFKNTKLILNISNNREFRLQYGDQIHFTGDYIEPETQRNYKGFDYAKYLKTLGIYGTVDYIRTNSVEHKKLNKIDLFFRNISNNIEKNIKKILSEDEANLLIGLLLGETTEIDENIKENFRNSGLYHILAVSGTHVVYVIIAISYLVDKMNISSKGKKILKICGIICFSLIVNNTVSVIRAVLMAIIAIGAEVFFRHKDIINSIATSMLIILICNPYNINSISFQLSYMGVIGIVILNATYLKLLVKIRVKENLAKNISVILAAQTAIIPIMIINYHTISLTFLLANLLSTYITGAIIILGFLSVIISFLSLKIARIFSVVLSILINFLNLIAKICGEIPCSKIFVTTPKSIVIVLYYILLVFICRGIYKDRMYSIWKQIITNTTNKRKIIITVLIVIIISSIYNYISRDLHIYFIDVGQGDSTLIITPNNKKILIDGGGTEENSSSYDVGENTLVPYLLNRGIKEIDFIMISHFDTDHSGGIIAVLESINVKNIIISKQIEKSHNFTTIMNIAISKNINVIVVKKGDVINVDNDVEIRILYPENKLYFDDLNNNSIVAKLLYKNFSILFTGDIESKAEERVIEITKSKLQATILKVAHHGSITSSTEEFLKYVKPKIALIGVGKNNKFGHPNEEVLERLNSLRGENLQDR